MGASSVILGLTEIEMQTKSATTVEAIEGLWKQVDDMQQ